MSWTRLSDLWTDSSFFDELSFEDRWHYLCMIQFCSRTEKYDGIMRLVDAKRCSDHPAPGAALTNLEEAELVQGLGKSVKVLRIDDHLPPPSVRENAAQSKVRMQRKRKHDDGDHTMCLQKNCDKAPTGNGLKDVTRNSGTGRDRSGLDDEVLTDSEEKVDLETGEIDSTPISTPISPPEGRTENAPPGSDARVSNANAAPRVSDATSSEDGRISDRGKTPGPSELWPEDPPAKGVTTTDTPAGPRDPRPFDFNQFRNPNVDWSDAR